MPQQYIDFPLLYVNGMNVERYGPTLLFIRSGQCRDSTNSFDIPLPSDTFLNSSITGLNGLDTGTIQPDTTYAVYVIYDNTLMQVPATLLSTSFTGPKMPFNYSNFRRIGFARTNSTSQFYVFFQKPTNTNIVSFQWATPRSVLSGGNATTFTEVPISSFVPTTLTRVYLEVTFTPADVGNLLSLRPNADSNAVAGVCPVVLKSNVAGVSTIQQVSILTNKTFIEYMVTSASDSVSLQVTAFEDAL